MFSYLRTRTREHEHVKKHASAHRCRSSDISLISAALALRLRDARLALAVRLISSMVFSLVMRGYAAVVEITHSRNISGSRCFQTPDHDTNSDCDTLSAFSE